MILIKDSVQKLMERTTVVIFLIVYGHSGYEKKKEQKMVLNYLNIIIIVIYVIFKRNLYVIRSKK